MFAKNKYITPKYFAKFTKKDKHGNIFKFRIEPLPMHRFNEFIDFKLNHFVKYELGHVVSGIPKNSNAMSEYKQLITEAYKDPLIHTSITICCREDNESDEIVGFSGMKLINRGDKLSDALDNAQSTEIRDLLRLRQVRNSLYSAVDVMAEYNIDSFFDDEGMAVHDKYRQFNISRGLGASRRTVSQLYNVPMAGAWITALGSQKTAHNEGWKVVYEISFEEIGKRMGRMFDDLPLNATAQYMVAVM